MSARGDVSVSALPADTAAAIAYADLVFDRSVYPRLQVEAAHVIRLTEALHSGRELPPIVVEYGTNVVVDGYHRSDAYFEHGGDNALVPAIERTYATKADLVLDAIRLNAQHGLPLADEARCVALAEKYSITTAQLADVLHVRADRIASLRHTRTLRAHRKKIKSLQTRPSLRSVSLPPETSTPLAQINKLIIGLQSGDVNVGDKLVADALHTLIKAALWRLKKVKDS
jgi:hypothetical protein